MLDTIVVVFNNFFVPNLPKLSGVGVKEEGLRIQLSDYKYRHTNSAPIVSDFLWFDSTIRGETQMSFIWRSCMSALIFWIQLFSLGNPWKYLASVYLK